MIICLLYLLTLSLWVSCIACSTVHFIWLYSHFFFSTIKNRVKCFPQGNNCKPLPGPESLTTALDAINVVKEPYFISLLLPALYKTPHNKTGKPGVAKWFKTTDSTYFAVVSIVAVVRGGKCEQAAV